MKGLKSKYGYIILAISIALLGAVIQYTASSAMGGKLAYNSRMNSRGYGYTSDSSKEVKELKAIIREKGEYYIYKGDEGDMTKESMSIEAALKPYADGCEVLDAGPVEYIKVIEPLYFYFKTSTQSTNEDDFYEMIVETLEGDIVYEYKGINESVQTQISLEAGIYLISKNLVAHDSDLFMDSKITLRP